MDYNNNEFEKKKDTSKQVLLSVLGVAILIVAVVGISFAAFTYSKAGVKENVVHTGTLSMKYTEVTNGINIENAMPMTREQATAAVPGAHSTNSTDETIDTHTYSDDNVFDFTVEASITGNTTINYEVVAQKANSTDTDCTSTVYQNAAAMTNASSEAGNAYAQCSLVSDNDIRLLLMSSTNDGSTYTEQEFGTANDGKPFVVDTTSANDTTGRGAMNDGMVLDTDSFSTQGTSKKYYRLWMWVDKAYVVDGTSRSYKVKVNVYGKGTN